MNNLTDLTLDHVFHSNIIAYCQHNRYIRLPTYADLFTLKTKLKHSFRETNVVMSRTRFRVNPHSIVA